MKRYCVLSAVAAVLFSFAAQAGERFDVKHTGERYFRDINCRPQAGQEWFDECGCVVSVDFVAAENAAPGSAGETIGKILAPQGDLRSYCGFGDAPPEQFAPAEKAEFGDKAVNEARISQKITYRSETLLAVQENAYIYSGGAHGIGGIASYLIDLSTGQRIPDAEVLNKELIEDANAALQAQLAKFPEGEIFEEYRTGVGHEYIDAQGNCGSCAYVLREDGLYVIFQEYAVGPYSSGNIEVKMPVEFVAHPLVLNALGKQ